MDSINLTDIIKLIQRITIDIDKSKIIGFPTENFSIIRLILVIVRFTQIPAVFLQHGKINFQNQN